MLLDAARHGVFADHAGHYVLRLVDAMQPAALLADPLFAGKTLGVFRAVFLNYLLDCLPAAVVQVEGEAVKQLYVRTCVARNVRLEDHTDLTAERLAEDGQCNDAAAQRELLEVYGLFAVDYDYRLVDVATLPLGEFAVELGRTAGKPLLHSYGAMQALERLLALVHEDGFILASDYGPAQVAGEAEFEHQRFSHATFVGVNFGQLKAYFGAGRCDYVEPDEGPAASVHSRLLGRQVSAGTRQRFLARFDKSAAEAIQGPAAKARESAQVGKFQAAWDLYREAYDRQPSNWVLLSEMAQFQIFSMRDLKTGIELAKVALALNPACSSELWNVLGDGLFEQGRYAEAGSVYRKALEINASDVRTRYNLAWVYQREKDYARRYRCWPRR